jgi:hypothetical protein
MAQNEDDERHECKPIRDPDPCHAADSRPRREQRQSECERGSEHPAGLIRVCEGSEQESKPDDVSARPDRSLHSVVEHQ